MFRLKLGLSIASIGLIYYGSSSVYSFFVAPGATTGKALASSAASAGSNSVVLGASALIGGLILAFGCIFWWASSVPKRRRRYEMPVYTAPYEPSPGPGRTLSNTPVSAPLNADKVIPNRHVRPIVGAPPADGVQRPRENGETPVARRSSKLPPPFDPY